MRTRTAYDPPGRLGAVCRRFDRWRETRAGCSRIPAALWASAVKAAGRHGLNPTAQALGQRSRGDGLVKRGGPDRQAITTFVELATPASGGVAECLLEMENPSGAKMRVHLKGVPAPDLAALSRSFWSLEA